MKLSYYIDSVIPSKKANTIQVMKMCQAFEKEGVETTLVCDGENDENINDVWEQYGISKRFNIIRVCIPKIIRRYGHRIAAIYSAWRKTKLAPKGDYAYSRSIYCLFFLRHKTKYIYEAHSEPDLVNRFFERSVLNRNNCIGLVVISNALKERYLELYPLLNSDNVYVLHDGADIESKNIEAIHLENLVGTADVKIGYVGHLYPGKCMETLIPMAEKCTHYSFHVIGGTQYWIDYWKKETKEKKIDNIIFHGFVNNGEIGAYYNALDISLLPFSKNIYTGKNKRNDIGRWTSPLKLFESMAYAKTILVSRLPTIEEVLADMQDCVFVDPNNIDDWVTKLNYLVDNESVRGKLGLSANEKLKKDYTWEKRAKRVITIIGEDT